MHGKMSFNSNLGKAKSFLLDNSISEGTKTTYATNFMPWVVWRAARQQTLLLDIRKPETWEDEICDFYSHVGYNMGYSWSYCHGMLYAIRRVHRLARIPLDVRDDTMPLLTMLRKGLKRLRGSPQRKIAATIGLLLNVYIFGGLNFDLWDDLLLWTAILCGFYFLLRSSEYLRKGAAPDELKCARVRNLLFAQKREECAAGEWCDEVVWFHEFSKNDQQGQGSDNNITRCRADPRQCIPTHFNKLREMAPLHFKESNGDAFVFTCTDGRVLTALKVERALRDAGIRMGLDPRIIAPHSLRAGGCSAMFNKKVPEHLIQRRGRWVSNCWKIYAWSARGRMDDLADVMSQAPSDLFSMT